MYLVQELTNSDFLHRINKPIIDEIHIKVDKTMLQQNGNLRNLVNLAAVRIKDLSQIVRASHTDNAVLIQERDTLAQ